MRVYMNLGDRRFEDWLKNTIGSAVQWVSSGEEEYSLVSRIHDAQVAVETGKKVLFVAGQSDREGKDRAKLAQQLGIEHILTWHWQKKDQAGSLILAFLLTTDREIPAVELSYAPFKIKVLSTKQSGGTFFAWNLWASLLDHGESVQLLTVSSQSPLAHWNKTEIDNLKIGMAAGEQDGFNICVIDASDTTEPVEADLTILIRDIDPAKECPSIDDSKAWYVVNRVPQDVVSHFSDAHLVIHDFASRAFSSMTQGIPIAKQDASFSEDLWNWYMAIKNGSDRQVHMVIGPAAGQNSSSGKPSSESSAQNASLNVSDRNPVEKVQELSSESKTSSGAGGFDIHS